MCVSLPLSGCNDCELAVTVVGGRLRGGEVSTLRYETMLCSLIAVLSESILISTASGPNRIELTIGQIGTTERTFCENGYLSITQEQKGSSAPNMATFLQTHATCYHLGQTTFVTSPTPSSRNWHVNTGLFHVSRTCSTRYLRAQILPLLTESLSCCVDGLMYNTRQTTHDNARNVLHQFMKSSEVRFFSGKRGSYTPKVS